MPRVNGTETEKKLFAALEKLVGTVPNDLTRDARAATAALWKIAGIKDDADLVDSIQQITEAAQEGENLMYEIDPEWDMPEDERKGT